MPIETRHISPDSEISEGILAKCIHCDHNWHPYENTIVKLPHEEELICPECKEKTVFFWADEQMKKELLHQKYILKFPKQIENAKKKIEAIEKERDDWKNKHDKLLENNTKLSNAIDKLATKLEQLGVETDESDKNPLTG